MTKKKIWYHVDYDLAGMKGTFNLMAFSKEEAYDIGHTRLVETAGNFPWVKIINVYPSPYNN